LCHSENSLLVTKNQFLESLRFSALCGSNHSAVGVFAYTDFAKRFHNPDLSRRFVTTRLALKKAINLPDRAWKPDGLQVPSRVGDTLIH